MEIESRHAWPTALITKQHSLSDAKDFMPGYRTLGLGKVVDEQTADWMIFASNVPLIDGSIVRSESTDLMDQVRN